jgi:hypothetical protein
MSAAPLTPEQARDEQIFRRVAAKHGFETAPVLNHRITYADTVGRLAELAELAGFRTAADLPPLETEEVAAALTQYPAAFLDALADLDTTRDVITNLLARRTASRTDQHAFIGYAIVAALADHLRPILWKEVESLREANRRNHAIERDQVRAEERAAVREGALS